MLSPTENAMIAYAILEQVDADREGGVDPTYLTIDVARAQVYATLATVPQPPSRADLAQAIQGAMAADGYIEVGDTPWDAADAVKGLL